MSLYQYLPCLSPQAQRELYDDLLKASIAITLGGNPKPLFEKRRDESKGKTKKLYAALCHAKISEIQTMAMKTGDLIDVVKALKAMTPKQPVKQHLPVKKSCLAVAINSV